MSIRRLKGSVKAGAEPLTTAEESLLQRNGILSHVTLQHFFAKYPELDPSKAVSTQDEKRLKKQCAKVVDHHFNGEYGIVAELQDIGIMDAEGHIKDPRRILWWDECPQMMDYACKGRRDRAIGIKGVRLQAPD